MLLKLNSVFIHIFVVNVKWMTIMKDIKQGDQLPKGMEMNWLYLIVCKCQKWVENVNQTQLKPIIWYTSWYFSKGGKKNSACFARFMKNIYPPPPTESIYAPAPNIKKTNFVRHSWEGVAVMKNFSSDAQLFIFVTQFIKNYYAYPRTGAGM